MAAIWVLKSHLFPYKLIGFSEYEDFSVYNGDYSDYNETNGELTISLKVKNNGDN